MALKQVSVRVEEKLAQEALIVFGHYGIDLSTAFKIFLSVTANEHRIPVDMAKKILPTNKDKPKKTISKKAPSPSNKPFGKPTNVPFLPSLINKDKHTDTSQITNKQLSPIILHCLLVNYNLLQKTKKRLPLMTLHTMLISKFL